MYIPVLLIESIFLIYFLFSSHPPILQKLGQEFVSNNCAISSFNRSRSNEFRCISPYSYINRWSTITFIVLFHSGLLVFGIGLLFCLGLNSTELIVSDGIIGCLRAIYCYFNEIYVCLWSILNDIMDSGVNIMVFMYSRVNGLSLVCWYNLNYYNPFQYYLCSPHSSW